MMAKFFPCRDRYYNLDLISEVDILSHEPLEIRVRWAGGDYTSHRLQDALEFITQVEREICSPLTLVGEGALVNEAD